MVSVNVVIVLCDFFWGSVVLERLNNKGICELFWVILVVENLRNREYCVFSYVSVIVGILG